MHQQHLDIFLHQIFIGQLTVQAGRFSFNYDPTYLNTQSPLPLSVSMPLQQAPFSDSTVSAFFSGLLPDELLRKHLARYLGFSEKNTFALLREIGGECAGAVSIYPEGMGPSKLHTNPSYRILKDAELKIILSQLDKRPLFTGADHIRISGAGAQNKLIIAFIDHQVAIPIGSSPSTHILKPEIKGLKDSVYNEFFCMKLASTLGLTVPEVALYHTNGQSYYLVKRYDRYQKKINGTIERLHQEDFCQALSIQPEHKYESEGGPGLTECIDLLNRRIQSGAMSGINKILFLRAVLFNFMIGNGDAHGKNFSLLYQGEEEALAPLYDLLCTQVYIDHQKGKMAMKLGQQYKFKDITAKHLEKLGPIMGMSPIFIKKQAVELAEQLLDQAVKLAAALNQDPQSSSPIYEQILKIISKQVKKITG